MSKSYRLPLPKDFDRKMLMHGRIWTVRGHALSDVSCGASRKWRNKLLIGRDSVRYLKIRRYLVGSATMLSGKDIWHLGPGATYLIDQSREVIENSSRNRQLNLFVHYDDIGYDPELHTECIALSDNGAGGMLVAQVFAELMNCACGSHEARLDAEFDRFIHVLRLVLEQGTETNLDARLRTARKRLVLNEIGKRALTPGLTVDRLLTDLPFSRATVYRDFAESGGIARAVRRKRMIAAWHLLADADTTPAVVERTALKIGFGSIHSFSKAFKRETGFRPSDVVGMRTRAVEHSHLLNYAANAEWQEMAGVYDRIRNPYSSDDAARGRI
ncbi:helix-turn-helix domain-containing protein [Lutimaribacter marinistellae]|uniref:Helix-turn-helix domain-containing protein n=2 Tax=Lutimaribacter marinistellae TaxID=1820329 RepID=A0ABV7TDE8_9RHOB